MISSHELINEPSTTLPCHVVRTTYSLQLGLSIRRVFLYRVCSCAKSVRRIGAHLHLLQLPRRAAASSVPVRYVKVA